MEAYLECFCAEIAEILWSLEAFAFPAPFVVAYVAAYEIASVC